MIVELNESERHEIDIPPEGTTEDLGGIISAMEREVRIHAEDQVFIEELEKDGKEKGTAESKGRERGKGAMEFFKKNRKVFVDAIIVRHHGEKGAFNRFLRSWKIRDSVKKAGGISKYKILYEKLNITPAELGLTDYPQRGKNFQISSEVSKEKLDSVEYGDMKLSKTEHGELGEQPKIEPVPVPRTPVPIIGNLEPFVKLTENRVAVVELLKAWYAGREEKFMKLLSENEIPLPDGGIEEAIQRLRRYRFIHNIHPKEVGLKEYPRSDDRIERREEDGKSESNRGY